MNSFPDHIQWLWNKYSDDLQSKAASDGFEIDPYKIMQTLMAADPSQKKGAVDWLVRTWIANGFRWEDISAGENSKVAETLLWFGIYRKKLEGNKRNLNEYTSLGEVYNAIHSFIPAVLVDNSQSAKEIKRQERDIVMQETKIICKTSELIIAVPLTEMAAVWWGKGTRWCTSAQENNYFNRYNACAPLVISIFPKGIGDEKNKTGVRKFQFQSGSSVQFMDESDSEVREDYVWSNWLSFKPLILSLKELYPETIKFVPPDQRTLKDYMDLINAKCPSLKDIPLKFRTKELCDLYLEKDGAKNPDTLRAFPKEFLTKEVLLKIVRANIRNAFSLVKMDRNSKSIVNLKSIVEDIKLRSALKSISKELYDEPVNVAQESIRILNHYLPKFLIEKKLFFNISNFEDIDIQDDLFKKYSKYMDQELWAHIVKHTPYNIRNVPLKYLSANMLITAIRKNPYILSVAPLDHIKLSTDFYLEILKTDGNALQAFPSVLKTPELCKQAVSNYGTSLHFVPEHMITDDLCRWAVEQNGKALEWVPMHMRTTELCRIAVKQDGRALDYCPHSFIDKELVRLAVEKHRYAGRSLSEDQLTAEICLIIVEKDPGFVREFLPVGLMKDKEFIQKLLIANPHCSLYIDPDITEYPEETRILKEQIRNSVDEDSSQRNLEWEYSILDTLAESIQEISGVTSTEINNSIPISL